MHLQSPKIDSTSVMNSTAQLVQKIITSKKSNSLKEVQVHISCKTKSNLWNVGYQKNLSNHQPLRKSKDKKKDFIQSRQAISQPNLTENIPQFKTQRPIIVSNSRFSIDT